MQERCYGRKEFFDVLRRRVGDLKEGYRQNIAILGSQHVGKSVVLQQFVSDMDDSAVVPVYLDLKDRDIHYFASKLIRSLLYHYAKLNHLPLDDSLQILAETVRKKIPETVSQALSLHALVEQGKIAEAYEQLLMLPEVFAKETNLFCVIVLDEFHVLDNFGIKQVFRVLADRITTQKRSLYVLSSSFELQAKKILAEKLTLLFGNFEILMMESFDLKESREFIERRLGSINMGGQLRHFLADFTGGSPLYLEMILNELTHLSATYHQEDVYAPLIVQAIENKIFYRWGALSRHFELVLNQLCVGKSNRLVLDILIELSNGIHKAKDIVAIVNGKQAPVVQRLNYLVDADVVEKNGSHYHMKDKLMRYWVKYVFQKSIRSIEMEPGRFRKEFKEELNRAISAFHVTSRQDLAVRMTDLLSCFENEQLSLKGRRYRLPAFHSIQLEKIPHRSGQMELLKAETQDGLWVLVLRKDPLAENDIAVVSDELKKMGVRFKRCILVSLSDLDDGARLRALEERMWIWNTPELNSLMNLYDKPYIVL